MGRSAKCLETTKEERSMRQQAEQRTDVLSVQNDTTFLPAEITVVQIDHRSGAIELVRWISGEEVERFSLSACEVEELLRKYRNFRRARPSLLRSLATHQDHEEDHHFDNGL